MKSVLELAGIIFGVAIVLVFGAAIFSALLIARLINRAYGPTSLEPGPLA